MPHNRHITRNPDIMGGEPCIAGRRITTRQVWRMRQEGWTYLMIAGNYRLGRKEIDAALRYERRWVRRLGRRVDSARQRLGRWLLDD